MDGTVGENVAFPIREHTRLPDSLIRHIVLTKLHAIGLRGAADLMPAQLSGGHVHGEEGPPPASGLPLVELTQGLVDGAHGNTNVGKTVDHRLAPPRILRAITIR